MAEGGDGRSASEVQEALIPMEDAVEALMNNLVAPLLPLTAFYQTPPTIDQQKTVAKQMHSVVLLYNYDHRKKFPELKFLTFEPFCKLASIAKPSLLLYMNFMLKNEKGYKDYDNHFSIVEKMVMDACNISSALDASKSDPNMDRWPISQVAVFLVDPKKEKCLLEFRYITESWSLVEKELDGPVENLIGRTQINDHSSNKLSSNVSFDEALEHEKVLQKVAYAAVEQKTGQNHSKFSIVEFHTAYSLNQEKTTTRLYIMTYIEAVDEGLVEFPVRDVISSLHEPLIRTGQISEVTSAVKYYHLLPYLNALSDWLSREIKHCGFPFPSMRHPTDVNNHFLLESGKTLTTDGYSINRSNQKDQALSTPNNNEIKVENKATSNKTRNNSPSRTDSLVVDCGKKANPTSINDLKIVNKSTLNEYKNRANHTTVNIKRPVESCRSALSSVIRIPNNIQKNAVLNQLQVQSTKNISTENINSDICISKRENNHVQDASTTFSNGCTDKQCHFEEGKAQSEMNIQVLLNCTFEGKQNMSVDWKEDINAKVLSVVEDRDALCSNQMHVVKSCISRQRHLPERIKGKVVQEAVLSLQSSCQELDDICCENSWTLPKYEVFPSTADDRSKGMFRASVTVKGLDLESTVHGDMKSSRREARSSAAVYMLSKLRCRTLSDITSY